MPEARRLFPEMTVRENVMMGAYARSDRAETAKDLEHVLELFPASANGSHSARARFRAASSRWLR